MITSFSKPAGLSPILHTDWKRFSSMRVTIRAGAVLRSRQDSSRLIHGNSE